MWRPNKITFLIIIINNIVNSVYNNYKPDECLNLIYLIIKRSFLYEQVLYLVLISTIAR